MKLLASVVAVLSQARIGHCLIGAAAMAAHGTSRSTADLDLLVTDSACLGEELWRSLGTEGASVEVRRGDREDPLAGLVRVAHAGQRPVDVVVGRWNWQAAIVDRASPVALSLVKVPVARPADLVLLKLYAAGPQDAWDVESLLAGDDGTIAAEVEQRLGDLPADATALWQRLRTGQRR